MRERKPNRLKDYDYSHAGCYFITVCTKDRENYFGDIEKGKMVLNEYGKIANDMWVGLPKFLKTS
jgi:putative transposase